MTAKPLFVHCCHCRWCQRETGASFALNAMIESDRVVLLSGAPEVVLTPSNSGKGQKIARCPQCRIALWSNYAGAGDVVRFVRVGTLDKPDRLPPDIHIFTSSKQPWVVLPARHTGGKGILRPRKVLAESEPQAAPCVARAQPIAMNRALHSARRRRSPSRARSRAAGRPAEWDSS
jgi:hypothetical protein